MKTRFLKLALLAVFCVGATVTNAQTKLSEEAVKVIKELKQVDTKGLSAEETQTALKVLNQIKKQHSDDFVAITAVGETKAPAMPAKNGEAKLGSSKSKPMVVDMTTGMGMKPIRVKYVIDGREVTSKEYFDVMRLRGNDGAKYKHLRDKESLAKYNAQGYDEVWIIETIKEVKSTEPAPAPAVKAVKTVEPANKNEARVGTEENPMDISMITRGGAKQIRAKYILDGREITSSKYWDMMAVRGNSSGFKTKMFKDKESLAKYNAQGYDEVWVLETVKVEKSTTPRVTKFKQNGNQVSFRIEVPKSAEHAKQKVDIEYEL